MPSFSVPVMFAIAGHRENNIGLRPLLNEAEGAMAKPKTQKDRVRPLRPAPKRELQTATRKRIASMKANSPRAGVRVERREIVPNTAKLRSYRRLRAALEKKLAESLRVDGLDAVFAAGDDLRRTLAGQLRKKRKARKGR